MVFGLLACNVWPIACTAHEPARSLFVVCELLGWDEIFGKPGMILEHTQKLSSLLIGEQAESDRRNEVVAALGPCVDGLGWAQQKNNKNQSE
jgi:hypothetical protein